MEIILGVIIVLELLNISFKLADNNTQQKEIIERLAKMEKELAYNKITNLRLTDIMFNTQQLFEELIKVRDVAINLQYYIGAVYHQELKEFAKKKEKGL